MKYRIMTGSFKFRLLLWGAAVSLSAAAAGCAGQEPEGGIAAGQVKVDIVAEETGIESRTVVGGDRNGGFSASWTPDDRLGVFTHAEGVDSQYLTFNSEFGIEGGIVDGRAVFSGNISCHPAGDVTYSLHAYYPYNPAAVAASHRAVPGEIPARQEMTAGGSFDPSADYMAAVPGREITVSGGSAGTVPVSGFRFTRLVTLMNVSVKDIIAEELDPSVTLSPEDGVESVAVTLTKQGAEAILTGNFVLDLAGGTMDFGSNVSVEPNRVEVVCPQGTTLGNMEAWLVTAPFAITEGDELRVTIITGQWEISKTITTAGHEFIAGGIKTLNMTIDGLCGIRKKAVPGPDRFTITPYDLEDSYAANYGEHTMISDNGREVTFFMNQVIGYMRPEVPYIEFRTERGYFYNITDLGRISSIAVNNRFPLGLSNITVLEGSAMEPSGGVKVPYTVEDDRVVYHFSGNSGFFYIHTFIRSASTTARMDYIEVNYVL